MAKKWLSTTDVFVSADGRIGMDLEGWVALANKASAAIQNGELVVRLAGVSLNLDWQESVKARLNLTANEPAAPKLDDRYVNTHTGNSSVTAQAVVASRIYTWNGESWNEMAPNPGMAVYDEDAGVLLAWSTSEEAWIELGSFDNFKSLTDGSNADELHVHSAFTDITVEDVVSSTFIETPILKLGKAGVGEGGLDWSDGADQALRLGYNHASALNSLGDAGDTVTGTNLNTLTDGSDADTLHIHADFPGTLTLGKNGEGGVAGGLILRDGLTPGGTVTLSPTNLDTLTAGVESDADALHTHGAIATAQGAADTAIGFVRTAAVTFGLESDDKREITVTVNDGAGEIPPRTHLRIWVSQSAYGAPSPALNLMDNFKTGTFLRAVEGGPGGWAEITALTDLTTGVFQFDLTVTGAASRYVIVDTGTGVYTSAEITYAGE